MCLNWTAVYTDGQTLCQFDKAGAEHSSEEIDRSRLSSIYLNKTNGHVILVQHFEPGMKVIFRRRVEQSPGRCQKVGYLLGWNKGAQQSINLVLEDCLQDYTVENFSGFVENHPWMYPFVPVPADLIEVGPAHVQ